MFVKAWKKKPGWVFYSCKTMIYKQEEKALFLCKFFEKEKDYLGG